MKLIHETKIDGAYPVKLYGAKDSYRVTYGAESFDNDSDLEACKQFGIYLRHALECSGLLDYASNYCLYDSETTEPLSATDLKITHDEYTQAIADSIACDQPEGHIRVNGRRVYAAEE